VLGKLRTEPTTAGVPVFVVSADASAGQVARLRAAGAAGYLTKPLDVQGVLTVLDGVIRGRDDVFGGHVLVNEGD